MPDSETTVLELRNRVRAFVTDRDWESFHNPKDLASAIAIEAGELMEVLLWKSPAEVETLVSDQAIRDHFIDELSDVVILCMSLANRLGVDMSDALLRKLETNADRYPVDLVRGKSDKYSHYRNEL